jgi:hypothetical protein
MEPMHRLGSVTRALASVAHESVWEPPLRTTRRGLAQWAGWVRE